jgi:hypothetical protein
LLKYAPVIHEENIYLDAEEALCALNTLISDPSLGSKNEERGVTIFEANLFAYTYLLVGHDVRWAHSRLPDLVKEFEGLLLFTREVERRMPGLRAPLVWERLARGDKELNGSVLVEVEG